ncbi:MAG TPA: aquaporin [Actinobacteria bacterium]|jgi:aquaporin Z|nr:aquaporin [Actinomycetota bacterium]
MANWQRYAAEAYGTFVLVLFGTGAVLASGGDYVAISLAFGLALVVGLFTVGRVSGGHFNPAVSLGAFLDKRISLNDMLFYWVSQVVGAVIASFALVYLASKDAVALTTNALGGLEAFKGLVGEAILTAIFVMVILVASKLPSYTKFIAIGFALTAVHLAGIGFTSSGVNPARSLAPAIASGEFGDIWVFLLGPAIGAILGWVLYKFIVTGDTDLTDDVKAMM